ncbi:DUF4231 domain-containing protein [Streptomyces mirabilis]|uniref:DUF4231 domain-containing protein n=1 Tax=Streptomyces mirabilis TaxID=68239 RepID=UPI0037ACAB1D
MRTTATIAMIVDMHRGPSELILTDDSLPSMFRSADSASLAGQADTVRWSALQLAMLVIGAVLGGVDIKLSNGLDVGALVAAIALLTSLIPALWLTANNPQRTWYRGRAAAESLRTLSWKYAMRAEPFAGTDSAAEERLLQDMAAILRDLGDIGWPTGAGDSAEITEQMRRLRRQPLRVRQHAYLEGRLDAEHMWYTAKARRFTRIARRWTTVAFIATLLGLAGGFVRAFGLLNYDGLGSASAIAAAATAWVQLKQYRPLAAAYSLTSHELLLVKAGLETLGDDEAQWSRHCSEAEEAISREHTMWLARREAA